MTFPIDQVRAQFPALATQDDGRARIYFDAPGGTQICRPALDRMVAALERGIANAGGAFSASAETDTLSAEAHHAVADLLGGEPGEIAFGPNMTTLTFSLSRALAQEWREGDEIVLTRLDHDANVSPWLLAARDRGVTVRWIDIDPDTTALDLDGLRALLNQRTRLVALPGASNALGTITDIAAAAAIVRAHSQALIFVDAVQSVPHVPTDVRALGCDFLACSPYKFFGPHQGVLWGRGEHLDRIEAYKVRPSATNPPAKKFETGTPSFEAQAGVLGTMDYLTWLGGLLSPGVNGRREALVAAMTGCETYEQGLGQRLLDGLGSLPGIRLYGPPTMDGRIPTFGFTVDGHEPRAVAEHLGRRHIFTWSGSFYAVEPIARLGLADSGGLVRVGLCHYSTAAEIDRLLEALGELA
jgi:cysteine desulfurase family protein (TIGR01976 family)